MSQSPNQREEFEFEGGYAQASRQLNKLVRAGRSYSGHERNCCFLNVHGDRFANVSLVSGFDFAEDARAVAVCDWDDDGDQDFWVANRTAPQLRYMQNEFSGSGNFVSFQLVGTKSNRDAIGARVHVRLEANGKTAVLQRTVRAGEGFLAGHSKRLHFGLAGGDRIESVQVTWPSGMEEEFGAITHVNVRCELVEGSRTIRHVSRPNIRPNAGTPSVTPVVVPVPTQTWATHNILTEPVPVPPLRYRSPDGSERDATTRSGRFLLVNLWASWCQPCLVELADWSKHVEEFDRNNVSLLALSVDEISANTTGEPEPPSDLLQRIGFRGDHGLATPQCLDGLQQLHNVLYDHHRPLPIPTSILLDANGHLRALYKGSVSVDRIMADVQSLASPESDAVPFPGKWLGKMGPHNVSLLVEQLFDEGYENEASAYAERLTGERWQSQQIKSRLFLAERLAERDPAAAAGQATRVLAFDARNAPAHERLALILARAGKGPEALHHFEQATLNAVIPQARTHFNYGRILRNASKLDQATEQFLIALRIDPKLSEGYEQLGLTFASRQDFNAAAEHFQRAVELRPHEPRFQVNLAMALSRLGKDVQAWHALSDLVNKSDAPPMALLLAAKSLENLKRYPETIPLLQRFLARDPKASDVAQQLELMRKLANQLPGEE